jgi:hypothetical protein
VTARKPKPKPTIGGRWQPPAGRRDPLGPTEAQLQDLVEGMLDTFGWHHWHVTDARRQDLEGVPDVIAYRGPRLLIAELKVPGYTTTDVQAVHLEALDRTGAEVYLWYPADMDDAERILR